MTRQPVTVAVLAGVDRSATRAFLAVLSETLAPRDDVVVVGPGRSAGDVGSWRLRGPRRLVRPTARPPLHGLVVAVDERTVPLPGWINGLVAALADAGVAAAAPRTNIADGDELLVGIPYRPYEPEVHRSFAHRLAVRGRTDTTPASQLSGPALAVRRSLVDAAGGVVKAFAEPDPIARLSEHARRQGRLVVAEASYLHHGGGPSSRSEGGAAAVDRPSDGPWPLVSACLIVRDEHQNLPRCLSSLGSVADEVVVYDTGSVDDTVEVARSAGATVVEGYWDDDFARARNDALSHCRGRWVLWVDADEALVCPDPSALREQLATASSDVEGYLVHIDNLRGTEASTTLTHPACRLFRRASGHWIGRLHEQVGARAGTVALSLSLLDGARITHWGYLQAAVAGRAKGTRNVRGAFADLAGDSDLDLATRLASLGRSHLLARHLEEGIDLCRLAAATPGATPPTIRLALRAIVEGLLTLDRPEEALVEIDRLRRATAVPTLADFHEGNAYLALERFDRALAAFDRVVPGLDDDGFEYEPHFVASGRAQALAGLGRHAEAADALLATVRTQGGMDAHVGALIDSLEQAGRPLSEMVLAVPPDRAMAFVPQLLQLRPEAADRALEAWYAVAEARREVLAAAAQVATALPVERQLVWSARLRADGLPGPCPLVGATTDRSRTPRDRLLAAAVAVTSFGDPRARQAFGANAAALPPALPPQLLAEVSAVAPPLLPVLDALAPLEVPASLDAPAPHEVQGPPGDGGRAQAGTAPARDDTRRVLVVDRQVSNLRTLAVAGALRRYGHDVTLAHPQPAAPAEELLGPSGVTVHGWADGPSADGSPTGGSPSGSSLVGSHQASSPLAGGAPSGDEWPRPREEWRRPCEALVARLYAERSFDTVVVAAAAADVVPAIRRLIPLADVVVDDGVAVGPAPVPALFPAAPAVPLPVRAGVCVVGNFRQATPGERQRWAEVTAPALVAALGTASIAVVGDDPGREMAAALPLALSTGPVADPTPWLRTARAVVVAVADGAEPWLAAAADAGTPALLVPDHPTEADRLARAVAALVELDDLWLRIAPPAAGGGTEGDGAEGGGAEAGEPVDQVRNPLAGLPGPRRRPPSGGSTGTGSTGGGYPGGRPAVRWVGDVFAHHSLAHANREIVRRLAAPGTGVDVVACTAERPPYPADTVEELYGVTVRPRTGWVDRVAPTRVVEVRHQWPPDLSAPANGRLVVMQPWEFGDLPAEWVGGLRDVVDELWVATTWGRDCAVSSGVPDDKVQVVPYGVDVDRFRPEGARCALRTTKRTRLLFVGGCIERKGIDILLEAYLGGFGAADDVCLVVKPFGSDSVYRTSTLEADVRRAAAGRGAEVEVVDGDLTGDEMAALYRSCDALVHPYRGEGFGLPIAEAMACGLPVVVPDDGACLDFCNHHTGWLVPARRVPIAPAEWTPTAGGAWWSETSRLGLVAALRQVVADPAERRRRGAIGRDRIAARFTWERTAATIAQRLVALTGTTSASGEPGSAPGEAASVPAPGELDAYQEVLV